MTETLTVQLDGKLLPDGDLFLYAVKSPVSDHNGLILKRQLFAWDESTLYGTLVETCIYEGRNGIRLNPVQTFRLFTTVNAAKLIDWQWVSPLDRYPKIFHHVQDALENGQFVPSFEAWKRGDLVWKLRMSYEVDEDVECEAEQWLNRLLSFYLTQDEVLKQHFDNVMREQSLLSIAPKLRTQWSDEEQWRRAIGLQTDGIPFRLGIRLSEPEGRSDRWGLELVILEREPMKARLFGSAEQLKSVMPLEWVRFSSMIDKTVRFWLAEEEWLKDAESGSIKSSLDAEEAFRFLSETAVRFTGNGIPVYLPSTWKSLRSRRPKIRAVVASPSVSGGGQNFFNKDQLFTFNWQAAIGDTELSEEQLRKLAEGEARMEKVAGEWVMLSGEMIREIQTTLNAYQSKQLSVLDLLKLQRQKESTAKHDVYEKIDTSPYTLVTEQDFIESETSLSQDTEMDLSLNGPIRQLIDYLEQQQPPELIEVPDQFQGELRPYQRTGASWLVYLRRIGLGCCLADDMGLGKTIQFIVYLQYLKEMNAAQAPSLLICPTSVLGNWLKEFQKFAPNIKVKMHYGSDRLKGQAFVDSCEGADIVISTYALSLLDQDEFRSVKWDTLCLDEAQHIKNAYTKQASAIRKLEANHRIAMTGTPLENRLTELWSIFHFINPNIFGSLKSFQDRYVKPIEIDNDQKMKDELKRRIRPFLLRREKNDPKIGLELPGKTESKTYVSLTAEQAELYQHAVTDMLDQVERLTAFERKGWIVSRLARLKQICDHPALVLGEVDTESIYEQNRSYKLERLTEMVSDLRELNDQCLIFTQYVGMGHILKRVLERRLGEEVLFMHGSVTQKRREEMIEQFQSGDYGIFVLSLRTGGSGLNLTAASHVFHYDRWWNPAVEEQATDRVYRIGQRKQVYVYKMVALGTLEERIDEMLTQKKSLTSEMIDGGGKWITEMSVNELKELLTFNDSMS